MTATRVLYRDIATLSSVFFGYSGLDRLYAGCYASGTFKFLLFAFFMMLGYPPTAGLPYVFEAKIVLGTLALVWYLYDVVGFAREALGVRTGRSDCGQYAWIKSRYSGLLGLLGVIAVPVGLWVALRPS